ncbi:MAG: hypothetical protein IT324_13915 [Anaerolineae bacterium]|nr:hypothetical protein [Anaerolineae bacterium]
MEALLNVTMKQWSNYEDRRIPPEIHTHDVLLGDQIILEAMGQRYCIHVAEITPETITIEVEGLSSMDDHRAYHRHNPRCLRRFTIPRNRSLSLAAPTADGGPTWTIEWSPGMLKQATAS